MTPASLSARDRRALLAGGAVLALTLALGRGLPALLRWRGDLRASAAELSAEAVRAERGVRALAAMRDSLAARRRRLAALDSSFVDGAMPEQAGAALAELVAESATAVDVTLGVVQVRPDTAAPGPFTRVAVRASVSGTLEAIALFLAGLEEGPALLAVRELSVAQPEPGIARERLETLRAEVVVEGLARPGVRPGVR